ncbi:MAG TPA: LppX_LprAFG lipoprotein [Dehalococcoidia bacterium]|nr:LppX_LprAFG lipoprotein [Dehalococcoidia bacterium]
MQTALRAVAPCGLIVALLLAACGSTPDAATLLSQAKTTLDSTPAVHFQLTSDAVGGGNGPLITGGSGDIKRPASFTGTLDVTFAGLSASVEAVSAGGKFYVRLPGSPSFQLTNPAAYGFADPGQLMDPNRGLSTLLLRCTSPAVQNDDRLNGELLHEVSCTLPGSVIAALLVDAAPSKPVNATIGITTDSHQVRRVVLTGPFYTSQNSTFTLVLDNYGENVTVTAPPL